MYHMLNCVQQLSHSQTSYELLLVIFVFGLRLNHICLPKLHQQETRNQNKNRNQTTRRPTHAHNKPQANSNCMCEIYTPKEKKSTDTHNKQFNIV